MTDLICKGCGSKIHSDNENSAGFVPAKKIEEAFENRDNQIICMRCFKIKNYGQNIKVEVTKSDYEKEVKRTIKKSDVVLLIVDIIDFEGSFEKTIIETIKNNPVILVINKIDLLPKALHPSEVSNWAKNQIGDDLNLLDVAIVSQKTGYGINGIIKKLKYFYRDGAKVAIVGVTNVGKSSIINSLIGNKKKITESKYPGTTIKTIKNKIGGLNLTIFDTPGLLPEGRASDLVCDQCNLEIVPSKEISRKTYKLNSNRAIFIGGLAIVKVRLDENNPKPIFSIYASSGVNFHETNEEKAETQKKEKLGEILHPPCDKCKTEIINKKFIKKSFIADKGEEIVIKGLGWITIKRGPVNFQIEIPETVEIRKREALISPRRNDEEQV